MTDVIHTTSPSAAVLETSTQATAVVEYAASGVAPPSVLETLQAILAELEEQADGGSTGGTVALSPESLAALESITVGGTVALDAPTLAALESILVSGSITLDEASLAALEQISVTVEAGASVGLTGQAATDLAATAAVLGTTADASSATTTLSAKLRSLAGAMGTTADSNSGSGSLMARVGSLLSRVGNTTAAAVEGDLDADLLARLRGMAKTLGTVADGGANNGTLMARLRAIANTATDSLTRLTEVRDTINDGVAVTGTVTVANPAAATDVSALATETTLAALLADVANGVAVTGTVAVSNPTDVSALATEATLLALAADSPLISRETTLAALLEVFQERTGPFGASHLITGSQHRFRREFNNPLDPDIWDITVNGAGASQSVTGGYLTIVSGTAADGLVSVVSKETFTAPCRVMVSLGLASRQANQESYVELVAVDPVTGLLDETRRMALRAALADSATATTIALEVQNGGPVARAAWANTTVPHVGATPIALWEMELESDECWFHTRLPDAQSGRSNSAVRQTTSPDPNYQYKLRIRQRNSAAVATPGTLRIGHVLVSDYTELQAEISGSRGSVSASQALPVSGAVTVSGTVGATQSGTWSMVAAPSATVGNMGFTKILNAASGNIRTANNKFYGFHLANTTASWRYLKLFDKTTAAVLGTDTPTFTYAIPPNTVVDHTAVYGRAFPTGLSYAITLSPADTATDVATAGDLVGHILTI